MAVDPSAQFSLSMQSISKLKYTARQSPEEGLKQTAQQFEALFLKNMLERMRDAMPESGLLRSNQTEMYNSLMDQQWAQTLAERGVGLADMMLSQLQRSAPESDAAAVPSAGADTLAGIPLANPRTLAPSRPVFEIDAEPRLRNVAVPGEQAAAARPPLMAARRDVEPVIDLAAGSPASQATQTTQTAAASDFTRDLLPDHVSAFLDRMGAAAHAASRETGIPGRLILAQAALETGWGRHEIKGADGRSSFNVFNIKATGWAGDSARVTTTEFENGQARKTQADFRVYDSYGAAFTDYARLLTESPRYAPVLQAPTAEAAARELQACGYATDPHYADKLVSIMSRIPEPAPAPAPSAAGTLFDRQAPGLMQVAAVDGALRRDDAAGIDYSAAPPAPPAPAGRPVTRLF